MKTILGVVAVACVMFVLQTSAGAQIVGAYSHGDYYGNSYSGYSNFGIFPNGGLKITVFNETADKVSVQAFVNEKAQKIIRPGDNWGKTLGRSFFHSEDSIIVTLRFCSDNATPDKPDKSCKGSTEGLDIPLNPYSPHRSAVAYYLRGDKEGGYRLDIPESH